METTNMVLCSDQDLKVLFKALNIRTEKRCGEQALFEGKNQKSCKACGVPISLSNLGHIAHGSNITYCKNPACFAHYIANTKLD